MIKNKTLSMFGLIVRYCSYLMIFYSYWILLKWSNFKCLFIFIVRSHLKYATTIWDSNPIGIFSQIEAVQNKFLLSIGFKFNLVRTPNSDYEILRKLLNLDSLKDRRKDSYITLKKKLFNNKIDGSYLSSLINFKTNSHNTGNFCLFYIAHSSLSYLL